MRDISELQHHDLFSNHMKKLRIETDELHKMLEARLETITKPLYESDSCHLAKNMRTESFRAVEASEIMMKLIYKKLVEALEKSFQKIDESKEVSQE